MTRYVLDASVVAKWHFLEPLSEQASQLLQRSNSEETELLAPDLILYEFGSVVLKKLLASQVSLEDAGTLLDRFPLAPLRLLSAPDIAATALTLAHLTGASFYDAVYLATAQAAQGTLITADEEFASQVRSTGLADLVCTLAEWSP